MSSKAKKNFDKNKGDVEQLWKLHEEASGAGVGRKHGVEVLNRAAVVFVNACWEAYVEDLAREAVKHIKTLPVSSIPGPTRAAIGAKYQTRKNPQDMWALADAGWKTVVDEHAEGVLTGFNTPRTKKIDDLFDELIGLTNLSSKWSWKGMSAANAAKKLDEYVSVRGGIVHRLKHDETEAVYKSWGTDYLAHVERLVNSSDEGVRKHLEGLLGKTPW